jgi:hypothetical protein
LISTKILDSIKLKQNVIIKAIFFQCIFKPFTRVQKLAAGGGFPSVCDREEQKSRFSGASGRPLKNVHFYLSSRKAKILTAGIH